MRCFRLSTKGLQNNLILKAFCMFEIFFRVFYIFILSKSTLDCSVGATPAKKSVKTDTPQEHSDEEDWARPAESVRQTEIN